MIRGISSGKAGYLHNLGRALAAVLGLAVCLLISTTPVHAGLNNTGPSDAGSGNLRYNLSLYGTHTYTHLEIPVYYRYNPGTVQVKMDFAHTLGGAKVSLNGAAATDQTPYFFNISGFYYDSTSGLYKSIITADLRSADGGTNWTENQAELFQFRLRLMSPADGWIAYGGGRVSQADVNYHLYNPGGDGHTRGSDQVAYMALPCSYTAPVNATVRFWDLDQPINSSAMTNGGRNIRVTITDETSGQMVANYYGPDHKTEMGEGGTLNIPITMEPGHQYRIDVTNIWVGNLIEYELPFDNISYATGCWEADGETKVRLNGGEWKTGRNAILGVRPIGNNRAKWNHRVWNSSKWDMPSNINIFATEWSEGDVNPAFNRTVAGSQASARGGPGVTFYDRTFSKQITDDLVGGLICQNVTWDPSSYDVAHSGTSEEACISVPYHYPGCDDPGDPDCNNPYPYPSDPGGDCTQDGSCPGTEPTHGVDASTSSDQTTATPGEQVNFEYEIFNRFGPTKTKELHYRIYTFIKKGGSADIENEGKTGAYPANWPAVSVCSGGRGAAAATLGNCEQGSIQSAGSLSSGTSGDSTFTYNGEYTIIGDWLGEPGDEICSYVALDNNWSVYDGNSANSYLASNIACVKIGKRPQIQINGSDSYAGAGFKGAFNSNITLNRNRGSYSQYGLLTGSGDISNFGSAGYSTVSEPYKNLACRLSYANSGNLLSASSCSLDGLDPAGIERTSSLPNQPSSGTISFNGNLSSLAPGTNYYTSGSLTIGGGTISTGARATIFVNGNLTITGNITNAQTSYAKLTDMPNLTFVVDGDINITSGVTELTGTYAAGGTVNTCSNMTNLGISGNCTNKLKINGAVISNDSPKLRRIFGSGNNDYINQWDNDTTSASSEWFNYTPNTWLIPYLGGGTDVDGYSTSNVTSLPSRY